MTENKDVRDYNVEHPEYIVVPAVDDTMYDLIKKELDSKRENNPLDNIKRCNPESKLFN